MSILDRLLAWLRRKPDGAADSAGSRRAQRRVPYRSRRSAGGRRPPRPPAATSRPAPTRRRVSPCNRLATYLVRQHGVPLEDVKRAGALRDQRRLPSIIRPVLELGLLPDEPLLADLVARAYGVPRATLSPERISPRLGDVLPAHAARQAGIAPLGWTPQRHLRVAMVDVRDATSLHRAARVAGVSLRPEAATEAEVKAYLAALYAPSPAPEPTPASPAGDGLDSLRQRIGTRRYADLGKGLAETPATPERPSHASTPAKRRAATVFQRRVQPLLETHPLPPRHLSEAEHSLLFG